MSQRHRSEIIFQRRIAALRLARGFTVRQLAALSQVPINTISRAERGLGISFGHAARLAEAYGYTLGQLLDADICQSCGYPSDSGVTCDRCTRPGSEVSA